MTRPLFTDETPVTEEVLNVIAHLPTKSLTSVAANLLGLYRTCSGRDAVSATDLDGLSTSDRVLVGLRLTDRVGLGSGNETRYAELHNRA